MTTNGSLPFPLSLFAIGLLACGGAATPAPLPSPPITSDVAPPATVAPAAKAEASDPNVRAVEATRAALDRCYDKARQANAALGRTTVTLKLRADDAGKVTKVDLEYTHKFDEDAKACMRDAAFAVRLPAGTTSASVPVVFGTRAK